MTKGTEAAPYAISVGNLEFNDKPRPKYMAIITHQIPMSVFFVVKDISPPQTYDIA